MRTNGTLSRNIPPDPVGLQIENGGRSISVPPDLAASPEAKLQLIHWIQWHWARRPEIRSVALQITRAENPVERARQIASWMNRHIRFIPEAGEVFELPGWVLEHRAADCDGHTALYGALAGSVGLDVYPRLHGSPEPYHLLNYVAGVGLVDTTVRS